MLNHRLRHRDSENVERMERSERRRKIPMRATLRSHNPRHGIDDTEDAEESEIGVEMWENWGKLVLDVPLFKSKEQV